MERIHALIVTYSEIEIGININKIRIGCRHNEANVEKPNEQHLLPLCIPQPHYSVLNFDVWLGLVVGARIANRNEAYLYMGRKRGTEREVNRDKLINKRDDGREKVHRGMTMDTI